VEAKAWASLQEIVSCLADTKKRESGDIHGDRIDRPMRVTDWFLERFLNGVQIVRPHWNVAWVLERGPACAGFISRLFMTQHAVIGVVTNGTCMVASMGDKDIWPM
jgi:hypothetical protein